MDLTILALVAIRAAALALTVAGDSTGGGRMYLLADAIEAGKATDEHMRLVAEKLKAGPVRQADWDDVLARIEDDHARLQAGS